MSQANGTKEVAKSPVKIVQIGKISEMVGKEIFLQMKNRTEDSRTGSLVDIGPAGALVKYESRGSLYHEIVPLQNVDSLYVKQALTE